MGCWAAAGLLLAVCGRSGAGSSMSSRRQQTKKGQSDTYVRAGPWTWD